MPREKLINLTASNPLDGNGELSAALNTGATSMTLTAPLTTDAEAQLVVRINDELIRVTAGANTTTPTIARAQEGTAQPAQHASGSKVFAVLSAAGFHRLIDAPTLNNLLIPASDIRLFQRPQLSDFSALNWASSHATSKPTSGWTIVNGRTETPWREQQNTEYGFRLRGQGTYIYRGRSTPNQTDCSVETIFAFDQMQNDGGWIGMQLTGGSTTGGGQTMQMLLFHDVRGTTIVMQRRNNMAAGGIGSFVSNPVANFFIGFYSRILGIRARINSASGFIWWDLWFPGMGWVAWARHGFAATANTNDSTNLVDGPLYWGPYIHGVNDNRTLQAMHILHFKETTSSAFVGDLS